MNIQHIKRLLSLEEANSFLEYVEESGLDAWDDTPKLSVKQHCLVVSDKNLAHTLYKRLQSYLPQMVSVSDRFKVFNYKKHQKSVVQKDKGDSTVLLNLTVFLNDDYTGGTMMFLEENEDEIAALIKPQIGDGVLYTVNTAYVDNEVVCRQKYVLRATILGLKQTTKSKLRSISLLEPRKIVHSLSSNLTKSVPVIPNAEQDDALQFQLQQHQLHQQLSKSTSSIHVEDTVKLTAYKSI